MLRQFSNALQLYQSVSWRLPVPRSFPLPLTTAAAATKRGLTSTTGAQTKTSIRRPKKTNSSAEAMSGSSGQSQQSTQTGRSSFFAWYAQKLETHPMLTKCISSGLISGSADLICQGISRNFIDDDEDNQSSTPPWDWVRTARFVLLGTLWVAPVTSAWYTALSTRIIPSAPAATAIAKGGSTVSSPTWPIVFKRVVMDQFVFAPIFLSSFLTGLWALEGDLPAHIATKLKQNAPEMVVAGWSLWIPAMCVNFSFVPLKYQVLYGNMVALAWNVYLSYKSASVRTMPQAQE